MKTKVCSGAQLVCSFGTLPSQLIVAAKGVSTGGVNAMATVDDSLPLSNIATFGACLSPNNPGAAAGTPPPCVPQTTSTWSVTAPSNLIGGVPALASDATLTCAYSGIISIITSGQLTITIPR